MKHLIRLFSHFLWLSSSMCSLCCVVITLKIFFPHDITMQRTSNLVLVVFNPLYFLTLWPFLAFFSHSYFFISFFSSSTPDTWGIFSSLFLHLLKSLLSPPQLMAFFASHYSLSYFVIPFRTFFIIYKITILQTRVFNVSAFSSANYLLT